MISPKGAKNKGNSFERKVASLLDKWWDVPKGTFWRSKNSGAFNEPGDITPHLVDTKEASSLEWPFIVECKHYKNMKFFQLFSSNKYTNGALILRWWEQLTRDKTDFYKRTGRLRIRLLLFRENNSPILVAFCTDDWYAAGYHNVFNFVTTPRSFNNYFKYYSSVCNDVITFCTWDEFSNILTKEYIIN